MPIQVQEQSDVALAKQVLKGNQEVFELLVQRYNASLLNFIYRRLGDYDLACDVLQQVFLRFYTSLPKLVTGESFTPWLFRVAYNCCVDELRRKRRQALHCTSIDTRSTTCESASLANIPDPSPLPEDIAEHHDRQILLWQAIDRLPTKHRSVVILRCTSQMSFSEIGQVLSMPETTAKTYFYRAKSLLRKDIERMEQ